MIKIRILLISVLSLYLISVNIDAHTPTAGNSLLPRAVNSTSKPTERKSQVTRSTLRTNNPAYDTKDLKKSFANLENQLSGSIGIAILPIGYGNPLTLGELKSGVAWSTAEVPISIAAAQEKKNKKTFNLISRAIKNSDNDAAEQLWKILGNGDTAALKTQKVLSAGGDVNTQVQFRHTKSGFSAFGQTKWHITQSAVFASSLPCRKEANFVYQQMGNVSSNHSWGLGNIPDSHFTSGWGPVRSGYVVRQLGVISKSDNTMIAIAIIVKADNFEQGTRHLNSIAHWLKKQLPKIPGGSC